MNPALPDVAERLRAPAAAIFDLAADKPDFPVALLRESPGLLLIGADPSSDDLLVLSGHAAKALNASDLVAIMGQRDSHQAA